MVSFKELMIVAASFTAAQDKDQGEYTPGSNAGDWEGQNNGGNDYYNQQYSQYEQYYDRTLWVHSHTPIQDYADPNTADFSNRRQEGSCIGFSNNLMRSTGARSQQEPWVMVSDNINDCAVVDMIIADSTVDPPTYMIYMKRRVDNVGVQAGYLSTRSEVDDKRNSESGYLSAAYEQVSTWNLTPYDDGFLISQATNSNIDRDAAFFNSLDWFLLAGFDEGGMYNSNGGTQISDLLIHGGQDGEKQLQTIFSLGDMDKAAYMTMSALVLAASAMLSMS